MKYKIIVDKQPRTNPSDEKKEYIVDIEELRVQGSVYDSLNIEMDRTYVTRRLSLSKYGVLSVLDTPIIEEITDVDIELFEGDNYIYLLDMEGNHFYAEYVVKNDFTNIFPSKAEMNSNINQTAQSIELSVNQKLTGYATNEDLSGAVTELNSTISQTAQEINLEVSKKVDDEELTGANITLRINNDDTSEATINADKININGVISANGNFKVDTNGNMTCNNANITGGQIKLGGSQSYSALQIVGDWEVENTKNNIQPGAVRMGTPDESQLVGLEILTHNSVTQGGLLLSCEGSNEHTDIYAQEIRTPSVTQTSLESIKKNISKFTKNATNIINNSDIYEYNLKSDEDTDKKLIGFVIGDNYKTPNEVISKDGQAVALYSAIGILWKAFQEQSKRIEELEKEVRHG